MKQSLLASIKYFFHHNCNQNRTLLCGFYKFKIAHKWLRSYNNDDDDNNNNCTNNFIDASLTAHKIANDFHLLKAWKYLQQCFTLHTVCAMCVCARLCSIGIDSNGGGNGGGGCHSTFHTTRWIFHKLFSQTAYNSVSFWGKLYLIELNVGLECIVKYCAFCLF